MFHYSSKKNYTDPQSNSQMLSLLRQANDHNVACKHLSCKSFPQTGFSGEGGR